MKRHPITHTDMDALAAPMPILTLLLLAGMDPITLASMQSTSETALKAQVLARVMRAEICLVPPPPKQQAPGSEYRLDLAAFYSKHLEAA